MTVGCHFVSRRILIALCCENFRHELLDLIRVVLFIHHIEARNEVWELLLADLNVLNHFLNVRCPYNLEPSQNEFKLKIRDLFFSLVYDILDDLQFRKQTHFFPFFIEQHT